MTSSPPRSLKQKIARFAATGVVATLIDLTVFAALTSIGWRSLSSNIAAWVVAVSASYVINSRLTFDREKRIGEHRSFLRFVSLGALISLGISSLALVVLEPHIGRWPAKLLGIVVAAILNFFAARWAIEDRLL